MKILHVVALIQASTGGPAVSVTRLALEQAKMGHKVTLACLDYPHLGPQVTAPGVRVVSVKGNVLAVRGRGWCPEFRRVLREEAAKADVVHNHGLWMWPNAYAREAAVAAGKPLIISPRGMLEAWSLGRSKLRKAVAWRLFERKNLQAAAMFHATAEPEAQSIRHTADGIRHAVGGRGQGTGDREQVAGPVEYASHSTGQEGLRLTNLKLKTTTGVRVVVAPNGVDLPDLARRPGREVLETRFPELKNRRWIVFMSRLHPKKGVDVLLRAWARQKDVTCDEWRVASWEGKSAQPNVEQGAGLPARSAYRSERSREHGVGGEEEKHAADGLRQTEKKESLSLLVSSSVGRGGDLSPVSGLRPSNSGCPVLVLAGSDLIGYRKDIERMVKDLGLEDSVVITGEVSGEAKDCLLGNADVFVLPSYSENFGIVVAEAMAWGRPVIASTGTPWKEIADIGAGWWVEPEEEALASALHEALGKGREELDAMGAKGRALVERSYGWSVPAERLTKAYEQILATDRHG